MTSNSYCLDEVLCELDFKDKLKNSSVKYYKNTLSLGNNCFIGITFTSAGPKCAMYVYCVFLMELDFLMKN